MKIKYVNFIGTGCVDVNVQMEDGLKQTIFSFYSDEISFTEDELIGLTVQQAKDLFHTKDVAYLQS